MKGKMLIAGSRTCNIRNPIYGNQSIIRLWAYIIGLPVFLQLTTIAWVSFLNSISIKLIALNLLYCVIAEGSLGVFLVDAPLDSFIHFIDIQKWFIGELC